MAETFDFDLICVGSGPAGQRAAVQAAKLGKRAAVIEKGHNIGGACIDTGTIPSKTFRQAVLNLAGHDNRPTAAQVLAQVGSVVEREAAVIENQLMRNDVSIFHGEASFKGPHAIAIHSAKGDQAITSQYILIAVGTRPAAPPGVNPNGETVISSDDITHMGRVPRTMTVVGAGVIGIEYASMFAALGVEVTVVDQRPRPLEFMDWEIVDELVHQMRQANVIFRFNEKVQHLEVADGPPSRAVILLESGKKLVSESALFSVGRIGDSDRLNLVAAGLSADDFVRIGAGVTEGVLRLEVDNPGATGTVAPRGPGTQRSGFGLRIVDALADAWGVSRNGDTRVWVELACWPSTGANSTPGAARPSKGGP